jgi:ATP-dependent DNA ligase
MAQSSPHAGFRASSGAPRALEMTLPLAPPIEPQLAISRAALPDGAGWTYEPKLDGFRVIAFVDGDSVHMQSRGGRPLERYFPEVAFPAGRYVVDGEIVIARGAAQDFEALQARIHPAASRIARLAVDTPATYRAFDLLALDDDVLMERPFAERRALLESRLGAALAPLEQVADRAQAEPWLESGEGVVAKELAAPYVPGRRAGMVKVKRVRTIDCVVVGYRPGKAEGTVGALILGLYEPAGELRVVGHASGFTAAAKRDLLDLLRPLETGDRGSAEASRWTAGRELEWASVRPELVAEVTFDHASGGRIRHGAKLIRWRPDRDPRTCGIEQMQR